MKAIAFSGGTDTTFFLYHLCQKGIAKDYIYIISDYREIDYFRLYEFLYTLGLSCIIAKENHSYQINSQKYRICRHRNIMSICDKYNIKKLLYCHHLQDTYELFYTRLKKKSSLHGIGNIYLNYSSHFRYYNGRKILIEKPMANMSKDHINLYGIKELVYDKHNDLSERGKIRTYTKNLSYIGPIISLINFLYKKYNHNNKYKYDADNMVLSGRYINEQCIKKAIYLLNYNYKNYCKIKFNKNGFYYSNNCMILVEGKNFFIKRDERDIKCYFCEVKRFFYVTLNNIHVLEIYSLQANKIQKIEVKYKDDKLKYKNQFLSKKIELKIFLINKKGDIFSFKYFLNKLSDLYINIIYLEYAIFIKSTSVINYNE